METYSKGEGGYSHEAAVSHHMSIALVIAL